jgi:hypothetical protein
MFKSRREIAFALSNEELAANLKSWPRVRDEIIEEICERAGLSEEYEYANGEYFEILKRAVDILGLEVNLESEIANVYLPRFCFTVLPVFGEIVMIKNGRAGFYPTDLNTDSVQKNIKIANKLNRDMNITKQMVRAMECGAMFGWYDVSADPSSYDEDGDRYLDCYLEEDAV